MLATAVAMALALAAALVAPRAVAASPRALRWSGARFAADSNAVEHVTLRGNDSAGNDVFVRFSMANAASRSGDLEITARFEAPGKQTFYAKRSFAKGTFTASAGKVDIQAPGNRLRADPDVLYLQLDLGPLRAEGNMRYRGAPQYVVSTNKDGFIERELLCPWGRLQVAVGHKDGREASIDATAFAVREASSVLAHRVYDRSVQVHRFSGGRVLLADYIVMPVERGSRPLGFVALRSGKGSFVGTVHSEARGELKRDGKNGYDVPYLIALKARSGELAADVTLLAKRQVSRKDDLAGLPYLARKAVAILIHPYTYGLEGDWSATLAGEEEPVTGSARWNYSQTR